ncbi:hypothetical protein [Citrobacter sp. R-1.5.2]|uniref:hypothetical protein n=1 Tax=Citrobacter sp. R-1.5.2 TaxID=3046183 RepID=UPI002B24F522|nr:hypothetical protein [Citrobacter sp. R-1.5.2]MEB2418256.1 hypothetical protein [Citrobacter sp. R-1.5.2]
MTALNKQALREEFQFMQDHYSDPADREHQVIYIAAEALLDENLQLQRDKDSLEAVAIAMRDDMRETREKLEAAGKRIAELSASHSKLRDTMATIHNTIRMDGGYTPLAAILNAAKRAHEESATAAGIGVKGE